MWECPDCSFSQNSEDNPECTGCGWTMKVALKLVSEETGQEKTLNLKLNFGKAILKSFAGDGAQYASDSQFSISPNVDMEWILGKNERVKNPTFHNGAEPTEDKVVLKNGDTISIGSRTSDAQVMKLTVSL